jgi:hypothetical protein
MGGNSPLLVATNLSQLTTHEFLYSRYFLRHVHTRFPSAVVFFRKALDGKNRKHDFTYTQHVHIYICYPLCCFFARHCMEKNMNKIMT